LDDRKAADSSSSSPKYHPVPPFTTPLYRPQIGWRARTSVVWFKNRKETKG
jgi:hypothetical protein